MTFPFATFVLAWLAADATAAPAAPAPPEPPPPPRSLEDLRAGTGPRPAIFTYTVDEACRLDDIRKLQGPDDVRWQDAQTALDVATESSVFRYLDGMRTRLAERRVKLLGEMVRQGELVCHVRPSGDVVDAWIEFTDGTSGRRRNPVRETVPISGGGIGELGTFSLVLAP